MGDEADGCCTVKRGFGIFILVLAIISFVGTLICALIASATYMPLYAAFGWISFLLLIYIISTASAYVCCQACGSKVTGGARRRLLRPRLRDLHRPRDGPTVRHGAHLRRYGGVRLHLRLGRS